jgi:putative N6-adenine-specific DNA methylase
MIMNEYFLTCPRGLEEVTAKDVNQYIEDEPRVKKGGISFIGDLSDMYKVNLYSRTGMYLLKKLLFFKANNFDFFYSKIYNYEWEKIIDSSKNFSIRMKSKSSFFENSGYTTLKAKDAIVDRIRQKTGQRPSIDKINSDIKIFIIIKEDSIKIFIDSSGRPLFMRGYRSKIHKASLNECLAAGLVLLSNWNKVDPFYDLMCGSGTIPIEAAMIAFNIPPGIKRKRFAFQLWPDYSQKIWQKTIEDAKSKINLDLDVDINGSDYIKKNINLGIESAKKIGLHDKIKFTREDLENFKSQNNKGVIILNPPYGLRLGDEKKLQFLYQKIGDIFKNECSGFDAYIFTHNKVLAKSVGLRTKRKFILKNGQLDCRLLYYPMQDGKFS